MQRKDDQPECQHQRRGPGKVGVHEEGVKIAEEDDEGEGELKKTGDPLVKQAIGRDDSSRELC